MRACMFVCVCVCVCECVLVIEDCVVYVMCVTAFLTAIQLKLIRARINQMTESLVVM